MPVSRIAAVFGVVAVLLLLVVDDQAGIHAALAGIAVAALVALGALASTAVHTVDRLGPPVPAEERRLRGGFRRQHRPDSPGRPMPRAPGPVF